MNLSSKDQIAVFSLENTVFIFSIMFSFEMFPRLFGISENGRKNNTISTNEIIAA